MSFPYLATWLRLRRPGYLAVLVAACFALPVARAATPTVTTPIGASVTVTTATLGGNVTADGGATITARGVVYSATGTNSNPQLNGPGVTNATAAGTTGAFTVDLTGLAPATAYTYAAYATNSSGTTYTSTGTFTTLAYTVLFNFTTLAGTAGNQDSVDGTGSAAAFATPKGIAVDNAGNIYVADSGNNTIRKITPGGVVTTLAGSAGNQGSADGTGSAAAFLNPEGVAVDSSGNVYVADSDHFTIRKITPGGVVTTLAGSAGNFGSVDGTGSAARFNEPEGVAVDSSGNVYVTDNNNFTIRKITPGGAVSTLAGSAGNGGPADGTGSAAQFADPEGIAVDSSGNLYVADGLNDTIRKITPGGVVTTLAGTAGNYSFADGTGSAAAFAFPKGVAVDSSGNVYVADSDNQTIRKITPGGVVTTIAGSAGNNGSADGAGSVASFNEPEGIAVDSAGKVYVADTDNDTIRSEPGLVNASPPTLTSPTSASLTALTATLGGTIPTTGGAAITASGVIYAVTATNSNPQLNGTGVTNVAGPGTTGGFTVNLTGLTPDTGYSYAAYATNDAGTTYTVTGTFTTPTTAPVVTSPTSASISGTTATLGGNVVSDGGSTITARGVVYAVTATNSNPQLNGTGVINVTGTGTTGVFTVKVTGLAADTVYTYAAYATNSLGTTYTSGTFTTYNPYNFTTLAGNAGFGSADGTGSAARFNSPQGVAVDSADNVYVADCNNETIRKITPGGVVTTLAGSAGSSGSADGIGSAALFNFPRGVAVDGAGNVYVADSSNNTIRKITPGGVVTTLAGTAGSSGSADGTGSAASFNQPVGVSVDNAGTVYVSESQNRTIRKITPAGIVTTLAGLAGNGGSADGTGSAARFTYPNSVAVDSAGNVYVADENSSTIRKITPGGVVTTLAGSAGNSGSADGTGSAAKFNGPTGVAVDSAGIVYVADYNNETIRKIAPGGIVTTLAGTAGSSGSADGTGSAASFNQPVGVSVDNAGTVYVSDSSNNTIRKITAGGVVTTLAGTAGSRGSTDGIDSVARFNSPDGVAVDGADNLYVADASNNTIRKITAGGVVSTLAGTAGSSGSTNGTGSAARFNSPQGVAVDGAGNVYVADQSNDTIRKIASGGVVTTLAGTAGSAGSIDGTGGAARFRNPVGVAVDSAGNVYVADASNHTIRKITAGGVVTTFAGTAGSNGSTDGTDGTARFNRPSGVAVDSAGNVYIADTSNHTIRKITAGGVVTTLAGTAGTAGSADGTGGAARFRNPVGVAVDSAGSVYVADTGNNTIRKITSGGVVSTLGGTPLGSGEADGAGSAATFNAPRGVAVDGAGTVYVADTSNNTIRSGVAVVISTSPTVTTPTSASIASTTATLGGNVTADGGATVTARGVVYSVTATNNNPQLNGTGVTNATGTGTTGVFTVNVTGLTAGTSYSYAAYATNSVGTTYTSTGTFTTVLAPVISSPTSVAATVTLGNTIQAYDGTAKSVSVTTSPAGLSTSLVYLPGTNAPVNLGTYQVVANITSAGYSGSAFGSLTIAKGTATVTLGADKKSATTIPAGLGVTLTFNGAATVPTAPGTYAVVATVNDPNYTGSATGSLVIAKLGQTISFSAPASQRANAGALTVSATASSGLPVTITIVSGPALLGGNTLTLTGAAGTVVLDASQAGNDVYAAAPDVTGSFAVNAVGQQVFFGSTGNNDTIAANLAANGINGTIIGYLAGTKQGFVVNFQVNADGTFTAPATIFTGGNTGGTDDDRNIDSVGDHRTAALASTLTFKGSVVNGVISGNIVELTLPFSANVQPPTGSSAGVAGYYQASSTDTDTGNTYSIVGTQGQVYVLAVTPGIVATGMATLAANDTFTVQSAQNATIAGSIDQPTTTVSGTITVPGQPATNFAGLATTTTRTDRLINLSSRAEVGPAGGATLVTGFVIGGTAPEQVLLRAVGPGLTSFGFSDALSNPRLVLYDSTGTIIAQNTGWPAAIAGTMSQVGAFPLAVGSADSAIATTLNPGAYTMQVVGVGSTGVALAEIYDASVNPQAQYQRLINISSRGTVSAGDGVLIGGFVITGNSPKTVLIRGIGPTLAAFGLPGVLADPKLAIYSGSTVIAQNDDWGTPVTVSSAQAAATAAQIASAAQATGAFTLPAGSKDSAVIVTLAPGSYTAQVSAANAATGVALVEIYEMP